MATNPGYRLLDFGDRKKLERWGEVTTVRPAPAAERSPKLDRSVWERADLRFSEENGWVSGPTKPPETWEIPVGDLKMRCRLASGGQLGLFPEQAQLWSRIATRLRHTHPTPLRCLSLFAYTGAATLAAASGAQVTHLDASRSAVDWARANAELNRSPNDRIRWIVEDARKFLQREIRRGSQYEAIIADPPTFGRGPNGESFKLEKDLEPLLDDCVRALSQHPRFLLVSSHTPGWGSDRLGELLRARLGDSGTVASGDLSIPSESGGALEAGGWAEWFVGD